MFVCSEVVSGVCQNWVEFSFLPPLAINQAVVLGFSFLTLSVTAWGVGLVATFLLKSR